MRHAGDGRTFMASAAVVMAGLVIATMLAINSKLQSALTPAGTEAGAPIVKVVPPAPAPVLQSNAPPSVAKPSAAAPLLGAPAAAAATVSIPAKAATVAASKTAMPGATLAATLAGIKTPVAAVAATPVSAVPKVTTPVVPAVTVPPVATPAVTVTIASSSAPASNSDIGDATASSGESHKKAQTLPGSSLTFAAADPTSDTTSDTSDTTSDTTETKDGEHHGENDPADSSNSHGHSHHGGSKD